MHALVELYIMADMYQMEDLMLLLCEITLESHLYMENVLKILFAIEKIGTKRYAWNTLTVRNGMINLI
jgi:hypothetical protein